MNLVKAELLAKRLIAQYLDSSWTFRFSHAKRWHGQCNYTKKTISLSYTHTSANDEEVVLDTILHEIAHALTPGAGHGPIWKTIAKRIGCTAKVTAPSKATAGDLYTWGIVDSAGKLLRGYTRKPPRKTFMKLPNMYAKNDPSTRGTLRIVPLRNGAPAA